MPTLLSTLTLICILSSCDQQVLHYLDTDYPGLTPLKYAEGIVNVPGRFQQNLAMSSDGREIFLTETDPEIWRYERILRLEVAEDGRVLLDTPQFVKSFEYQNEWFIGEPYLSPDDDWLYFVADYPPNVWRVGRRPNGDWNDPSKLTVSTQKADWYPTVHEGALYFTNGTLFRSLISSINTGVRDSLSHYFAGIDVRDPIISANGQFMIMTLDQPDGFGNNDLYISVLRGSSWMKPQNLGPTINSDSFEFAPYLSPDERFLFFSRRDKWQQATSSEIWWVSVDLLEAYVALAQD